MYVGVMLLVLNGKLCMAYITLYQTCSILGMYRISIVTCVMHLSAYPDLCIRQRELMNACCLWLCFGLDLIIWGCLNTFMSIMLIALRGIVCLPLQ